MNPESVEIKATLVGADVGKAVDAFELDDAKAWRIVFCEDVTTGVTPQTPLLNSGVVLRVRGKSGTKGDSTVKLRPCRWSQLSESFFTNRETNESELKIEADWAGTKRTLAASLTADWEDDRLAAVRSGHLSPADLFTNEQRKFLEQCSPGPVNLDAVTALAEITATRWKEFPAEVGGSALSCRAERWLFDGVFDFLELSIVSDLERAEQDQAALHFLLTGHSLTVEQKETRERDATGGRGIASPARLSSVCHLLDGELDLVPTGGPDGNTRVRVSGCTAPLRSVARTWAVCRPAGPS